MEYNDITETGYNDYRDLLSMNNSEYDEIQSYLDSIPPKRQKTISDKLRNELIRRQQQIVADLRLLELGATPASLMNSNYNLYNFIDYNLESQPYTTNVANTSRPFGESRYDRPEASDYEIQHIQDVRANTLSGFNKIVAGTAKGAVLAGTTFIDGTLGLMVGISEATAAWATGDSFRLGLSKLFNNEISNGTRYINELMENILPNYSSEYENSRAWYQNMGTSNFWADFIKQIGFTVGAFYSGNAWTKALKAANWINSAMGARVTGSLLSAANEARIEANNNSNDWKKLELEKFDYEFNREKDRVMADYYNGKLSDTEANAALEQLYQNKDAYERSVEERANKVGVADMALNIPILAINDFFMFGKAYSRGFNNANKNQLGKRTFKEIMKSASEELGVMENDLALNTARQAGRYAWNPIKTGKAAAKGGLGFLREGHEEVAQAFVAEASKNYFTPDSPDAYLEALYNPNAIEDTKDFYRSITEGFANTYGNMDTYQEFFMGGLNGLLGVPTFGRSQNRSSQTYLGKGKTIGITGGLMGNIREARVLNQQGQEAVDFMNAYLDKYDKSLSDGLRHFAASDHFTDLMNGWAEESNAFEYKNAQDNDDFEAIVRFNSVGKLDDFKQLVNQDYENISDEELDKIAKFTTSNEQWKNPDGTYMSESEEGRAKMRQILTQNKEKFLAEVDSFERAYETMTNITNDDLDLEKILELSWLKWKLDRFDTRFKTIKEENLDFFNSMRDGANTYVNFVESVGNLKELQSLKKSGENIRDLIDYVNDSKTTLEFARKLGLNYEAVEALQDDKVYDLFSLKVGMSSDEYKQTVQNLVDVAKMGKLAEQFDSRLKEYLEKPSKMQEAREKIEKKFDDSRKKKQAQTVADNIIDSDISQVAKNIEEYSFLEQDGDLFTPDGVNITGNLDEESKTKVMDKFNEGQQVKQTKDMMVDMIDKDDLGFLDYDIDASDKEAVQLMLQQTFDDGDIDMFDDDYNGDLSEYSFVNENETGTVAELQDKDHKRRRYVLSILANTQKQSSDSKTQKQNTPKTNTEQESKTLKQAKPETTGHDGVDKVSPVESKQDENPKPKQEPTIQSTPVEEPVIASQSVEYDDNIDKVTDETSQWTSGVSMLPLSRFRKENNIDDFDYTPLYKIVQEDPEGRYFTGPNETAYVENVGEYLYTHNAYENRHKGLAKVGSKVTFAVSKTLNDKVTQPVILIMDESGQNALGNLPLLNAKGNSRQLNDFINYCIERIDNDTTDDLQIIKDETGNNIQSEIDQNYTGRIPFVNERNSVLNVFGNNARFAISKEDGNNVGVYTSKTDFPNSNVRSPKRALKGQPFVLIKSSNGMEVTVPFFMRRYNAESSQINGNPTFFDQEVRKTVESIVNRNNNFEVSFLIAMSIMNKLNSMFSSQDFHINPREDNSGIIDNIYVGGKNASNTETTRRTLYDFRKDGVLTVDGLMDRIRELNMPINVDLNRINTKAKIGGVEYNTAIALMAEISLPINTYHTIDDWFTIKPVVDGKIVSERSDRYKSALPTQSVTVTLPNGNFIRKDNYDYVDMETGDYYGVDYDTDAFINNNDKSAELRLLDRAKLYVEQRLMQGQDAVIHLNLGQIKPLDYDIKNSKLIIPVQSRIAETEGIAMPEDLPASQVLQTQQLAQPQQLVIVEQPVQPQEGKIDYESVDMDDVENWYEEDCDIDGYNDVWNNADDDTKKKIYVLRDIPNLVDVFMDLANGSDNLLDNLINNTPLYRRVDNQIKSTEQVKKEELDWLKQTYPQLSSQERLKLVDGFIKIADSDNPDYAWGKFQNGVIYLSDKAADGTVYHEAFHAVAHTLMSNGEFNRMLNIARRLNPDKTNIELEEILAEDFRGYMLTNVSDYNDNFIQRLFKQLKNIVKGLFNRQYILNNSYYRISQGMYRNRQPIVVNDNIQYRTVTNPTIEQFTNSTIKTIKDKINEIGPMRVGSEDVIRLITGKNQYYNYRTKQMDYFDSPRQFINVGALFNAGYNSNSNYDTTGSDRYYNRELIVNEVRERISRLGYDNLVYVGRNEYGSYELLPIEDAMRLTYDSQYSYQNKPIEGNLTSIQDYFDLSGETKALDFLDKIIGQDTRIGFLADTLKKKLTDANNVQVRLVTPKQIEKIRKGDNLEGIPQGFFRPKDGIIYINSETTERPDKLFLHELIHSFAFNAKKSPQALKRLNSIYNDAVSQLEKKYGVSKEELLKQKKFYGLRNTDEFLSEFFSNGAFMNEIASLENQSEKKMSIKDKFMNWILNVLGIKSTSEVFDRAKQFLEEMLMNQYTVSEQQVSDVRDSYASYQDKYYMSEQYYLDIIQQNHLSLLFENLSEDRKQYLSNNGISEELYERMNDDSKEQLFVCMH